MKPGWKTTEFWIMLVVTLAGLLPTAGIFPTDSQVIKVCGLVVSAATALGWTYQRTSLKKTAKVLFFLLVPFIMVSCNKGMIRADAVAPLTTDVCDRHDKLVTGQLDPKSISEADKATYLRSSQLLRKVLSEAQK